MTVHCVFIKSAMKNTFPVCGLFSTLSFSWVVSEKA